LEMGSHEIFAPAGVEPWSSRSQPRKKLGLQVWATGAQLIFTIFNALGLVAHAYDVSTGEAKAEGLRVQIQPQQCSEFDGSLGYILGPCPRKPQKTKTKPTKQIYCK
jgi:hypothetical protein